MPEKHILIAEDEREVRLSLSIILKQAGYRVTTAEDGLEALRQIVELSKSDHPADLLVTDIMMPGMSGIELLDELDKQDVVLSVLVITGYGDKEMVVKLLRRGCSDFIDKPFSPQDLLDRLPPIFEKAEKARKTREKEVTRFFHEKAELNRQIKSYQQNIDALREQIESAVGAYQNLVHIQETSYKVSIAYRHRPLSELGGDFVDVRNTNSGCDILLADVAGHDMGASYHTVMIKAFFDENCRTGNDGQYFFKLLNRQLLENGKNERMVTAIFLRLNLDTMHGEIVSAGHPPLIRILNKVPTPAPLMTLGDVLGIHENVTFASRSFPLTPGDRFLLHTDGLTNAYRIDEATRKKRKLGTDGLEGLICKYRDHLLENMVGRIVKAITGLYGYKFNDDMLLLGVEIPRKGEKYVQDE